MMLFHYSTQILLRSYYSSLSEIKIWQKNSNSVPRKR